MFCVVLLYEASSNLSSSVCILCFVPNQALLIVMWCSIHLLVGCWPCLTTETDLYSLCRLSWCHRYNVRCLLILFYRTRLYYCILSDIEPRGPHWTDEACSPSFQDIFRAFRWGEAQVQPWRWSAVASWVQSSAPSSQGQEWVPSRFGSPIPPSTSTPLTLPNSGITYSSPKPNCFCLKVGSELDSILN